MAAGIHLLVLWADVHRDGAAEFVGQLCQHILLLAPHHYGGLQDAVQLLHVALATDKSTVSKPGADC